MTRFAYGYLWWGAAWILAGFLIPELLAEFKVAPWPTLSETTWHAIHDYPIVAACLFGLFIGLFAHLLYARPLWISLAFGIVVAAAAHLTDKAWP